MGQFESRNRGNESGNRRNDASRRNNDTGNQNSPEAPKTPVQAFRDHMKRMICCCVADAAGSPEVMLAVQAQTRLGSVADPLRVSESEVHPLPTQALAETSGTGASGLGPGDGDQGQTGQSSRDDPGAAQHSLRRDTIVVFPDLSESEKREKFNAIPTGMEKMFEGVIKRYKDLYKYQEMWGVIPDLTPEERAHQFPPPEDFGGQLMKSNQELKKLQDLFHRIDRNDPGYEEALKALQKAIEFNDDFKKSMIAGYPEYAGQNATSLGLGGHPDLPLALGTVDNSGPSMAQSTEGVVPVPEVPPEELERQFIKSNQEIQKLWARFREVRKAKIDREGPENEPDIWARFRSRIKGEIIHEKKDIMYISALQELELEIDHNNDIRDKMMKRHPGYALQHAKRLTLSDRPDLLSDPDAKNNGEPSGSQVRVNEDNGGRSSRRSSDSENSEEFTFRTGRTKNEDENKAT